MKTIFMTKKMTCAILNANLPKKKLPFLKASIVNIPFTLHYTYTLTMRHLIIVVLDIEKAK